MRFHQSWYRATRLKEDYGSGPSRTSSTPYGNMLAERPARDGHNFLTPEIRNVYEERKKSGPGGVEPFRCEHNMLSSQPMCFNLFGPLVAEYTNAGQLLRTQVGEVGKVVDAKIEFRPQQNPLKDLSAFDAFFVFEDANGERAFLGIETKLTDTFSSERYEYESHPGYGEFTRRDDSAWLKEFWDRLPEPAYNQLWRNQLLAEATKRLPEAPYGKHGTSILVHHPMDLPAAKVAAEYRDFLTDHTSFRVWRLDELVAAWSTLQLTPDQTDWLEKFQDRYLRLELSESEWEGHQANTAVRTFK